MTPAPILEVAAGLWAAGVLKSSIELKVLDQLSAGPQDVAVLSQTLNADPLSLQIVLDALVALGFVAKQAQRRWAGGCSSALPWNTAAEGALGPVALSGHRRPPQVSVATLAVLGSAVLQRTTVPALRESCVGQEAGSPMVFYRTRP